jgi:pyruvate formate lyase activating enzyme
MMSDRPDNIGVAYTYNEPTVFYEFMLATAKKVKEAGMWNVAVTNGFINKHPLAELLDYIDAFNIDLKAFTEDFYKRITSARLQPVKETILEVRRKQKHLELTNLVITGLNDQPETFEEMVKWIAGELGPGTPLHLSRYFPDYQMDVPSTPVATLMNFHEIAARHLHFVYLGNLETSTGRKTLCPSCHSMVMDRAGYTTYKTGLDTKGHCRKCGAAVIRYI